MTPRALRAGTLACCLVGGSAVAQPAETVTALHVPFVENSGQTDPVVAFSASTSAGTAFVTRDGKIVHSLRARGNRALGLTITECLAGGHPRPRAGRPTGTRVSYFHGIDRRAWQVDRPTYDSVDLGDVWKGIHVALWNRVAGIEKVFTVAPQSSVGSIRVRVAGAKALRVDESGALIAETRFGELRSNSPVAYQEIEGTRVPVSAAYRLIGDEYGFGLGEYDAKLPVIIDPLLRATYLGGTSVENARATAIHPTTGDVYVAGETLSNDFPGTAGGAISSFGGGGFDAFVARLDSTLTRVLQASYLGDGGDHRINAIAVHPLSGEIIVVGETDSTTSPGTPGGAQPALGGRVDAFAARLDPTLTTLLQATYLGGKFFEFGFGLAVHSNGDVFVAGVTDGSDLPGTSDGAQPSSGGQGDAFVARFDASLRTLVRTTYLGGPGTDSAAAVVVHPGSGEVIVVGSASDGFPATPGGTQFAEGGGFAARLDPTLRTIRGVRFLGGDTSFGGGPSAVAVHPLTGEVFVAGTTLGQSVVGTQNGAQRTHRGAFDAFAIRLDSSLAVLQATYIGGTGSDLGRALAFHPTTGDVFIAGGTDSLDFPATIGGPQSSLGGPGPDAFVARLRPTLGAFVQNTYLGGTGLDQGNGIAVEAHTGDVLIAGITDSRDFPGVAGGAQAAFGGTSDAFVARLSLGGGTAPSVEIPTVGPESLVLIAIALAAIGWTLLRRDP